MQDKPLGFEPAAADWDGALAGRPYSTDDWNSLTFAEQNRYARQECKTKGAVYSSRISSNRIDFSVALPSSLAFAELQEYEARKIERWLHIALEKEIAGIIQLRELSGGRFPNDAG